MTIGDRNGYKNISGQKGIGMEQESLTRLPGRCESCKQRVFLHAEKPIKTVTSCWWENEDGSVHECEPVRVQSTKIG